MRRVAPVAVAVAAVATAAACGGIDAAGAAGVIVAVDATTPSTSGALRGGAPVSPDGPFAAFAVGRVVDGDGGLRCTGAALGPRHIVTAGHCAPPATDAAGLVDEHTLGFVERGAPDVLPVVDVLRHPTRDVAVLLLGRPVRGAGLAVGDAPAPGDRVSVIGAGFQTPLDHVVDVAAFVVDGTSVDTLSLVAIDAAIGLCPGDSGAPVLAERDGAVVLVGVHVRGFDDCSGPSTSARVDVAGDFLAGARDAVAVDAEGCVDGVDADVCAGAVLRRCVSGTWRAVPCADVAYACVDGDVDGTGVDGARCAAVPCGDVSAAGRCNGGVALACIGGTLVREDCAADDGRGCALDPSTGRRGCVPCDACDGVCVDHDVDVAHCGACGVACARGATCAAGRCTDPRADDVDAGVIDDDDDDDDDGAGGGAGAGCSAAPAAMWAVVGLARRRRSR